MYALIFLLLYFYVFMPGLAGLIIMSILKAKRKTKTENFNFKITQFIYKVPMTAEELLNTLERKNVTEPFYCTVDRVNSEMIITEPLDSSLHLKYRYCIQEEAGSSVLRMEEFFAFKRIRGFFRMEINSFILEKLNAEKLIYAEYEDSWDKAFGRGNPNRIT